MGPGNDILAWVDLRAALGLLTRLPLPGDPAPAIARGARAAWAWPVAGAVVGALAALAASLALGLGLPPALAAAVALGAQVMVTGALHEDGLADSADGLWGGHSRETRLEIMKDSRTGTFGVVALVLSLLARWAAVSALLDAGAHWGAHWGALIAAGAVSRAAMAVLMAALPSARAVGLSHAVGRPAAPTAWVAVAAAAAIAVATTGLTAFALALTATAAALSVALIARAKIGGQTGDILGAAQQLAEIAVLFTLAAALA